MASFFVIDGGFSKAYQPETGIAGYTLVYHSHGMQLVQHEPFQSRQKAIEEGLDIKSTNFVLEFNSQRMMVKDTDKGKELVTQIQDLKKLLVAYRTGLIKRKGIISNQYAQSCTFLNLFTTEDAEDAEFYYFLFTIE